MNQMILLPAVAGDEAVKTVLEWKADLAIARFKDEVKDLTADCDAKELRDNIATLRKMRTQINDQRIAMSKEWNAPFAKFKSEVDSLLGVIDAKIESLAEVERAAEEQRKADKNQAIINLIHLKAVANIDCTNYPTTWLNKGMGMDAIEAELCQVMARLQQALDFVEGQADSMLQVRLLEVVQPNIYEPNLMGKVLEEQLKATQAVRELEASKPAPVEVEPTPAVTASGKELKPSKVVLEIEGTIPQLKKLKSWLEANGLGYKTISK